MKEVMFCEYFLIIFAGQKGQDTGDKSTALV